MSSQYKTVITPYVREKIEKYTLVIRDYYVALYSDTGLGEAELVIQSQYIEGADILNTSIIGSMSNLFSREIIPYSPSEDTKRETSFRLGSRRVFLTYEEDEKSLTRYITDIEILRR